MLVHQILKLKADDAVVTLPPSSHVKEAIDILAQRKIGTIVVSRDGQTVAGILSERDIVRELSQSGAAILEHKIETYMTADVVTCGRSAKADEVLQTMTDKRFRHMPVEEDGQLVGLITLGDVVKARLQEVTMEKDALEGMIMGH